MASDVAASGGEGSAPPAAGAASPSLPVLIVPGIICSALRVEQSSLCPEWEGQRIFAPAVGKVASSALKRKSTFHEDEPDRLQNNLLQHFVTKSPTEEVDGVRVRAIEGGLAGLNLFDVGSQHNIQACGFTQGNLYAGVIKALKSVGYTEGQGIECAAYDWRMAPGVLESRDQFFSRMKSQIERMNDQSQDRRGVVLLGHSMGNKVVQYFLNYIMASDDGQAWLDRHIYSWLLVGAPLLGAAYCGRMAVSGDCPYPGLDSVFSKHELVILYRSLGSLPWLFPIGNHTTHLFYVRRQGALEIQSVRANVPGYGFSAGNSLKLLIEVSWGRGYGRTSVASKESKAFDGKAATFDDEENFMRFGGPSYLPSDATISVTIAEKGMEDGQRMFECSGGSCCICLAPCALCRAACLACFRGARCSNQCWSALRSSARGEEYVGMPRAVTVTQRLAWKLQGGSLVTLRLPLRRMLCNPFAQGDVVLQLRWVSPENLRKEWSGPSGAPPPPPSAPLQAGLSNCFAGLFALLRPSSSSSSTKAAVRHRRRPREIYDKIPLDKMLGMLHCERAMQCWEEFYKADPLYNDAGTDDTPPLRRVIAVNGCDVRTEIGCVLRLNSHRTSDKFNVRTRFVPDDEAEIAPFGPLASSCSISAGALYEEPGDQRQAGDGTVPFCSLHHSSSWAGKLEYEEHFLSKSAHSVNMFDPRFHKLLMKVLTPTAR